VFENFSFADWLVLIPLIPAIPFLITAMWLPWERWLPIEKMARTFLGPYFLYGGFAAWYFKWETWYVIALSVLGIGVSVFAIVNYRFRKDKRPARGEPLE
jgi:hypothetical protein